MLNPKRERFCQEYVKDLNATQAYIRAGYSPQGAGQGGERLLRNVEIAARIAEIQAKVSERLELTQEKVLLNLEQSRVAAINDGQHSAAIKATELLGKHIGMWPNKQEITVNKMETMSLDELDRLIGWLRSFPDAADGPAESSPSVTH